MNNELQKCSVEEIKETIDKVERHKEVLVGIAEQHAKDIDKLDRELETLETILEAQIAEENKPELRHGDYGLDNVGDPCFTTAVYPADGKGLKFCGGASMQRLDIEAKYHMDIRLGNIFDEIKALQEDVTVGKEYRFADGKLRLLLDTEGNIHFRGDTGFWNEDTGPIITMLQRMQAMAKRMEAKK